MDPLIINNVKNEEFRKLVKKMRNTQSSYYRTKDRDVLIESKRLEKLVDNELDDNVLFKN